MEFVKDAVFIGVRETTFRDGAVLCTVTFYVDGASLEVNVLASNTPVMTAVRALSFGDNCKVTFMLRKAEKLYKLSLTAVA